MAELMYFSGGEVHVEAQVLIRLGGEGLEGTDREGDGAVTVVDGGTDLGREGIDDGMIAVVCVPINVLP